MILIEDQKLVLRLMLILKFNILIFHIQLGRQIMESGSYQYSPGFQPRSQSQVINSPTFTPNQQKMQQQRQSIVLPRGDAVISDNNRNIQTRKTNDTQASATHNPANSLLTSEGNRKVGSMSVVPRGDGDDGKFLCGKCGWILGALGILALLLLALLFGLGIIGGTPGSTKVGSGSVTPSNPFGQGKTGDQNNNLGKETNGDENSKLNGKNNGSSSTQSNNTGVKGETKVTNLTGNNNTGGLSPLVPLVPLVPFIPSSGGDSSSQTNGKLSSGNNGSNKPEQPVTPPVIKPALPPAPSVSGPVPFDVAGNYVLAERVNQ